MSQYTQASFRGIAFHVESATSEIAGRRTAVHEYAGRDTSYPEDLGGKAKSFSLTAYVIGKTYQEKRDALIKACVQKGVGELVHPYLGTHEVLCTGCSVSEGTDKGLMASFTLSFSLASAISSTFVAKPDTSTIAKNQADIFSEKAETAFFTNYTPTSMPSHASESLSESIVKISNLFSLVNAINALEPHSLAKSISQNTATLSFNDSLDIANKVANIQAPASTAKAGLEVMRLTDEVTNFTRRQALVASAVHLAKKTFISRTEAKKEWALVDTLIEQELEIASAHGDDILFFSAQDMRYTLNEHIKKTAVHLPEVESVLVTQSNASLPIAFAITGNANNAFDFEQRNKIMHPSFVSGGELYEVLND